MLDSTIAAISTPAGKGGIGIVRMSGEKAVPIAAAIFKRSGEEPVREDPGRTSFASHRLYHGHIVNPADGTVLDEVLLTVMKAPRSYTREDVVEINSHSGSAVLSALLNLVLVMGARIAEPGEFTKRAFLNGRIDLTQAEGVIDVINAQTETALTIASNQVKGGIGNRVCDVRESLLIIIAKIEAGIDFPDDVEDFDQKKLLKIIEKTVVDPLESLLDKHRSGRVFREGVRMAVVGRPNVGKSSLVNRMVQKERVIVTDIPGTTRDIIEEVLDIQGIPVIVTDTAGLHRTQDPVETLGIERTREYLRSTGLVLFLVEADSAPTEEDHDIYRELNGQPTILVINKSDLVDEEYRFPVPETWNVPRVMTSARYNSGISELKELIVKQFTESDALLGENGIVPNVRHKWGLEQSYRAVEGARKGLADGLPPEIVVMDLKEAVASLAGILGLSVNKEILDEIFSRFCIGK